MDENNNLTDNIKNQGEVVAEPVPTTVEEQSETVVEPISMSPVGNESVIPTLSRKPKAAKAEGNGKKGLTITIISIIAVLLIGGGITLFLLLSGNKDKEVAIKEKQNHETNNCETGDSFNGRYKSSYEYTKGQYKYSIIEDYSNRDFKGSDTYFAPSGWKMELVDDERTDPITTKMCTHIDGVAVTNMSNLFYQSKARSIDLSSFNTENVTNMSYMFSSLSDDIVSLDLSSFDTSKVTDMSHMFYALGNIASLDLSNFDTSNVVDMSYMFANGSGYSSTFYSKIKELDLSNFNTSEVKDMSGMFIGLNKLTTLDLSNFDTSNVTDMSHMFYGMASLENLNISSFDTSKVMDMSYMFSTMAMTEWDEKVGEYIELRANLATVDLSNFDTSSVVNMNGMFNGSTFTSLDLSNFDTKNVENMEYMFDSSDALESIKGFEKWDVSNVWYMYNMFSHTNLKTIEGVSKWDVSGVWDMEYMFSDMPLLESIDDISGWNLQEVNDMDYMFSNTPKLTEVGDISKWKLSDDHSVSASYVFEDSGLADKFSLNRYYYYLDGKNSEIVKK